MKFTSRFSIAFLLAATLGYNANSVGASCSGSVSASCSDAEPMAYECRQFGDAAVYAEERARCEALSGCYLYQGTGGCTCNGAPDGCSSISSQSTCQNQPGCSWSGGSSGGGGDGDESVSSGTNCFSGQTTIVVKNKGSTKMKDLQVGDEILTASGLYQPVYAFGHYLPHAIGYYLVIETSMNGGYQPHPLEITPDHMLFLAHKQDPVRADTLQVGDDLKAFGPQGATARITKISQANKKQGLYAPLTQDGTLVVNDLVASAYPSLQEYSSEYYMLQQGRMALTMLSQHNLVHFGLAPFRLACVYFGICGKLDEESGMQEYCLFSIKAVAWAGRQNVLLQVVVLAIFLMGTGVAMSFEYMLSNWSLIVASALIFFFTRILGRSKKAKVV